MDDSIVKNNLKKVFPNVSRETCIDLEKYIDLIMQENNVINLISRANINREYIVKRHIIDSMQIIDFIDFNQKKIIDLGSGSGLPGIILSIISKNNGSKIKTAMYEKSFHKANFLKQVSTNLNLNTEVLKENIFDHTDNDKAIITSRAFKPLPVVLELLNTNFKNFKNLIIFMGKTGNEILSETLKKWKLDYETKKSITNNDSFILNIKGIKKI
ncbi:16S rRNA (guanine(527)-N(7))-methyltransferase RsmG [Candidatus Pelagibacter sp.]|uniref:16S rRNA (guanine(527)-N(7))-methyltransferase RsmG n=1 Tax=Candidatus Pelagibacter sp. TaxID=2024849 RepID=UPI003F858440